LKKIVVMASGSGTTFEYLVREANSSYSVIGLVVNKPDCGAVERAKNFDVPSVVCQDDDGLVRTLIKMNPDFIVLAGYLKKISADVLKAFPKKILNTHPSLLPKYGGRGMYGRRVHQAVIDAGETESGVSIHWVSSEYDSGPLMASEKVGIAPGESAESLEKKVQAVEKRLLKKVIEAL
jgi:phosphoribosylglycinamide formyltransferase-1